MIWDWQVFFAGVGLGAMIYTPLGMFFMYHIIKQNYKLIELKKPYNHR